MSVQCQFMLKKIIEEPLEYRCKILSVPRNTFWESLSKAILECCKSFGTFNYVYISPIKCPAFLFRGSWNIICRIFIFPQDIFSFVIEGRWQSYNESTKFCSIWFYLKFCYLFRFFRIFRTSYINLLFRQVHRLKPWHIALCIYKVKPYWNALNLLEHLTMCILAQLNTQRSFTEVAET